jgi:c-di-GMP-binding flagellar brake protein YcgR
MQMAMILSVSIIVTAVIILIIYNVHVRRKRPWEEEQSNDLFRESADDLGLSTEEREKLLALLSYQKVQEPQTIFQSQDLFEQCVDAEVNSLLKSDRQVDADGPEATLLSEIRSKLGFSHLPLEHPLISSRNISMGQVGSLFGTEGTTAMLNKVSVVDNNSLFFTLQYEVEKEDPCRIAPGDEVRFVFARQTDGLYGVQVKVANVKDPGVLDLLHTLDIRRNQLRQYVRIETDLPLHFRLLSTKDPDKSEVQRGHLVTAKMSDISGGGLSFLHDQSLRLGDTIAISFDLAGTSFTGITGKIVHLSLREGKSEQRFRHHVQFVNIELHRRDDIIRYVSERKAG